jgi:hypothetical protein
MRRLNIPLKHPAGRGKESGQTLLFSMIAALILLLAVVFLFDIQSVVRVKMKSQAGVDAAAVAGANWQKHTLNAIGELNMIRACTVLISDISPINSDPSTFLSVNKTSPDIDRLNNELSRLSAASHLLAELQTRISFAGPLLGVGAAQQAAKNNGLNRNSEYGKIVLRHIQRILDDSIYGDPSTVPQVIENYAWREPYAQMLEDIVDVSDGDPLGFAVAVNTSYMGAPTLDSDPPAFINFLQDKYLYQAVNAEYWCYITLRTMLRMNFGSKWWGSIHIESVTPFPEEAEYLAVDVKMSAGQSPYDTAKKTGALAVLTADKKRNYTLLDTVYDAEDALIPNSSGSLVPNPADTDSKFNPLPRLSWMTYGSTWCSYGDLSDTWDIYLASKIKPEYRYYGAVAKVTARVPQASLSGNWRKLNELAGGGSRSDLDNVYLGDAASSDGSHGGLAFGGGNSSSGTLTGKIDSYAARMKNAEKQMKSGLSEVRASALAKVLGSLPSASGGKITPQTAGMVLPVFETAALIPVSLEDPGGFDPFDYEWYMFLTEYLPRLGECDSISQMDEYVASNPGLYPYHTAMKKLDDPAWRQKGIDWLDAEATGHDIIDDKGQVIGHVTDSINEDHCDDWGGPGPGNRHGPGVLH